MNLWFPLSFYAQKEELWSHHQIDLWPTQEKSRKGESRRENFHCEEKNLRRKTFLIDLEIHFWLTFFSGPSWMTVPKVTFLYLVLMSQYTTKFSPFVYYQLSKQFLLLSDSHKFLSFSFFFTIQITLKILSLIYLNNFGFFFFFQPKSTSNLFGMSTKKYFSLCFAPHKFWSLIEPNWNRSSSGKEKYNFFLPLNTFYCFIFGHALFFGIFRFITFSCLC